MKDKRIFGDGADIIAGDEIGEDAFCDLAVLEHIADTAGGAKVVFENIESSVVIPDEIDTCNMDIDVVRDREVYHLPEKVRATVDHFRRNDPIFQNELIVIDVFEKKIEGFQPLFYTGFDEFPFGGSDDPGNDIEGEDLFNPFAAAIDGEGDALAHEEPFGELFLFSKLLDTHLLEKINDPFVLRTNGQGCIHFIPGVGIHMIAVKQFAGVHVTL